MTVIDAPGCGDDAGSFAAWFPGAGTRYTLDILGTDLRINGSYSYQRLARHIAEVQMVEDHPAGTARYTLLLACLGDHQGRFIYTQHDGPITPRQRQNSGRWTLQP